MNPTYEKYTSVSSIDKQGAFYMYKKCVYLKEKRTY